MTVDETKAPPRLDRDGYKRDRTQSPKDGSVRPKAARNDSRNQELSPCLKKSATTRARCLGGALGAVGAAASQPSPRRQRPGRVAADAVNALGRAGEAKALRARYGIEKKGT